MLSARKSQMSTLLYAVCLCGLHVVIGYEQMDALLRSQSAAVHQLSSAGQGRDRLLNECWLARHTTHS